MTQRVIADSRIGCMLTANREYIITKAPGSGGETPTPRRLSTPTDTRSVDECFYADVYASAVHYSPVCFRRRKVRKANPYGHRKSRSGDHAAKCVADDKPNGQSWLDQKAACWILRNDKRRTRRILTRQNVLQVAFVAGKQSKNQTVDTMLRILKSETMVTAYDKLKLPKRAGRCWCGNRYYSDSVNVVYFAGRFQCVGCLPDNFEGNQAKQRRLKILNEIAIDERDDPM